MPRAWVEWNGVIVTQKFYCMMSNRQCDLETAPEKEAALPSQGLSVEERNSWPIFLTKQEGK